MTSVSVVIPTFNRALTLRRALASVFGQTRLPDEVIVADDGSTDGTKAIVGEFPSVIYLRLESNRGAAAARNAAIKHATSEYVAFLDSDDMWLSSKLEMQLQKALSNPAIILVTCSVITFDQSMQPRYIGGTKGPTYDWTFDHLQQHCFSTPTWLARRSALTEAGLFDESLKNREDLDLLARLLGKGVITTINEPLLIKYNQRDSLDADPYKLTSSLSVLLKRHHELWLKAPRMAIYNYRELASLYFRAGDMSAGRTALLGALKIRFWSPSVWVLLAISLVGRSAYQAIRSLIRMPSVTESRRKSHI